MSENHFSNVHSAKLSDYIAKTKIAISPHSVFVSGSFSLFLSTLQLATEKT